MKKINSIKNKNESIFCISLVLVLLLFLTSCSSNNQLPSDINYFTGSDGITIDLLQKETLDQVYEDSTFSYSMNIENKGADDVVGEDQAILTIGYDPYYIELSPNVPKNEMMTIGKGSIFFKGIQLVGKSKYYPSGSSLFFYFPYLKTKKIEGQRAKPETQIFSSICYPYSTYLTELACIDFDVYGENSRTQTCRQKDLSFSNQGAPVAITLIEVENQPIGNNLVRPVYTVHFSNVGQGTVLSPIKDNSNLESICSSKDLSKSDFNTVNIHAWLSNDVSLVCTPENVKLTDEEGVARCTIPDEKLEESLQTSQNYQAPITIKLDYVYLSTLYKTIEIKRFNQYGGSVTTENKPSECPIGQIKSKDGSCQDMCSYCAENLGKDSACDNSGSPVDVLWNPAFSCTCAEKDCIALTPFGLCAPSVNFCGGKNYCCSVNCKSTEGRYTDGKCYPKCSTSCSSTASKIDCVCGEPDSFELIKAGQGFCSSQKKVTSTIDECKADNGKTQTTIA